MACLYPVRGFKLIKEKTESGKMKVVFNDNDVKGKLYESIDIPCGQCIECRISKAREWAIRCYHEASMFENNIFLTLTYDEENVPGDYSLNKEDYRDFLKELRRRYDGIESIIDKEGKTVFPIRYFVCGEYGDQEGRPHYHMAIFNFDFDDKIIYTRKNGIPLYNSEMCEKIWKKGYCVIGDINLKTVRYITRYILKKVNGSKIEEKYGELEPEFQSMSRRPGIGNRWFQKFKGDIYDKDFMTIEGNKYSSTRYYDKCLEEVDEKQMNIIKRKRKLKGIKKIKKLHDRANIMREKRLKSIIKTKGNKL